MPNWVYNNLRVHKDYLFRILNKKNKVDFNLAMPMPPNLQVESGSTNDIDIYCYLSDKGARTSDFVKKSRYANLLHNKFSDDWIYELSKRLTDSINNNKNFNVDKSYASGEHLIDNFDKYGAITWYDWAIRNWGTKWNACESDVIDDHDDANYSMCCFNTAWSPPEGWLNRLCQLNIPFRLEWEEEQGYTGYYESDGKGNLSSESFDIPDDDDWSDCELPGDNNPDDSNTDNGSDNNDDDTSA
ncbi:hypothetical protein J6A31_06115 [bacterium]|nr:hypothetical protein [bacterium]